MLQRGSRPSASHGLTFTWSLPWPVTNDRSTRDQDIIMISSSWPLGAAAVTRFPPLPLGDWCHHDHTMWRVKVLVLVSALCTAISSRRQSVPIWIRSRPGISFCNVFATRNAPQNTTILAIYDRGMRYHYPGQVNKIELGNRGCRKYAQPKQSWPDLTPLKVGGEWIRHILIFHLFNLWISYPKHGKYETNVKIDDSHKSQIPVVIVADPRQ